VESESPDHATLERSAVSAKAITAGDELGFLYRRYREEILRFLRRTFGSGPPDPEDVVQIVFEKYAATAHDAPVHNTRAFLFRSARNFVIDERRRQSVRSEYAVATQATADRSDDLDAERVLEAQQRWAVIESAIGQLDTRSREMLLMNRLHGLSCAEIARRKGCSATLVKSIIARALVACHQALGDHD
jgi:RNA polymerase sigma-70 factor (ECF subfamily)